MPTSDALILLPLICTAFLPASTCVIGGACVTCAVITAPVNIAEPTTSAADVKRARFMCILQKKAEVGRII